MSLITATNVLLLTSAACLGYAGGHHFARAPLLVELAELRQQHAETARISANANARTLQAAQERGHAISQRLLAQQDQITALEKTLNAALRPKLTGRVCFDHDAVRLLNEAAAAAADARPELPKTSGTPVATGGTAATDHDVGTWIVHARSAQRDCKTRLDALIDWVTGATP